MNQDSERLYPNPKQPTLLYKEVSNNSTYLLYLNTPGYKIHTTFHLDATRRLLEVLSSLSSSYETSKSQGNPTHHTAFKRLQENSVKDSLWEFYGSNY